MFRELKCKLKISHILTATLEIVFNRNAIYASTEILTSRNPPIETGLRFWMNRYVERICMQYSSIVYWIYQNLNLCCIKNTKKGLIDRQWCLPMLNVQWKNSNASTWFTFVALLKSSVMMFLEKKILIIMNKKINEFDFKRKNICLNAPILTISKFRALFLTLFMKCIIKPQNDWNKTPKIRRTKQGIKSCFHLSITV